eukprot:Nk52_evm12s224 gene=Nk52_evmTU12s224
MPKSKRNKSLWLTKTQSKGHALKENLVGSIRDGVEKYKYLYVIKVKNMRNNKLKAVRESWPSSKFFFGKNKVMCVALGRSEEEEVKEGLHLVAKKVRGNNVGLLATDSAPEEVVEWFDDYRQADFLRSGSKAPETVELPAGPLRQFPHMMEPMLRELGLPTALEKGVIVLQGDYVVCKAGQALTPEQARVLKLLNMELAEFQIVPVAYWNDGKMVQLVENDAEELEEEYEDDNGTDMVGH